MTLIAVSLAGGCGAVLRLVVDWSVRRRIAGLMPWGTLLVNISGCLALGLASAMIHSSAIRLVVDVGLCGGYTTFSGAVLESVQLADHRRSDLAVALAVGTMVACTLAAAVGIWAGSLIQAG